MAATDKQESGFRYIITNNEHTNTKSMSFVVSNPSERPGYHISMKQIQIILNYRLNCIKIPINSCIHYRGYIPSGIIIPTGVVFQQRNKILTVKNIYYNYTFRPLICGYLDTCLI